MAPSVLTSYQLGLLTKMPRDQAELELLRMVATLRHESFYTVGTWIDESLGVYGSGRVLVKPASPGTGVIAGGPVRAVIESAGIQDILTKSLGSTNPHNVVKATMNALLKLRTEEQVRKLREIDPATAAV